MKKMLSVLLAVLLLVGSLSSVALATANTDSERTITVQTFYMSGHRQFPMGDVEIALYSFSRFTDWTLRAEGTTAANGRAVFCFEMFGGWIEESNDWGWPGGVRLVDIPRVGAYGWDSAPLYEVHRTYNWDFDSGNLLVNIYIRANYF